MSEQYTPTPWFVSRITSSKIDIIDDEGFHIARCMADKIGKGNSIVANAVPNSRRIAACVNACDGFSSEFLETVTLTGDTILSRFENQSETFSKIEQQRDDLLAALRGLMAIANNSNGVSGYHLNGSIAEWEDFEAIEVAERAIEKAEQ